TSRPQTDPLYKLLLYVKNSVENLLNLNVRTLDILVQNAKIVKNVFGNHTIIGYNRTLLTAMDIVNIKNQMIKKNWNISIQNDSAKNLEQFLGPDANLSELKEAYPLSTSHQNLILIDGTFEISRHKLLLFIILVIDDDNKGIPITFIIFIPPSQNRLTSFGDIYNKNQLKKNPNAILVTFSPLVAMTDADIKEHKALLIDKVVTNYESIFKEHVERSEVTLENSKNVLNSGVNFLVYLKRQWAGDLLNTNILYIILVYEVIPNILTLRNLAMNLEYEKAEWRKEFNIMDSSDHKILAQKFSQIAPNDKVLMYEIEKKTGKIYVQVESETTPHLIYTTCVYRDPTNICCQCPDFLQKGIMCKHLCTAALYIDNLHQQDQYAHLPEMIDNQKDYKNNDNYTFSLSEEIFNYMKQILGISTDPKVVMISNTPILTQAKANLISTAGEFNNSQNIVKSEQKDIDSQHTLMIYLNNIVISNSFKQAQSLVDVIYKDMNPHRHVAFHTDVLLLE
ncbi:40567_t:CDS:2, partial [Gigaspora margarita]